VPLSVGVAGFPSNTMSPGVRPTSILSGIFIYPAVWSHQTWAENWGAVPLLVGVGAGSPSNTMWPGPRPISMPSGILIHPTVWLQCTNITDRQTTDRQTGRQHRANHFTNGCPISTVPVINIQCLCTITFNHNIS